MCAAIDPEAFEKNAGLRSFLTCEKKGDGRLLWEAKPDINLREQSPVALAFVGDGVLEALVRARLVERTRLAPGRLHAAAVHFVCAKSQCAALDDLQPLLTEEEQALVRRGKNATKAAVAKHATPREYRASTALEALFGWLYLQNRTERLQELFDLMWDMLLPSLDEATAKRGGPACRPAREKE